jgi:hypothetical protein
MPLQTQLASILVTPHLSLKPREQASPEVAPAAIFQLKGIALLPAVLAIQLRADTPAPPSPQHELYSPIQQKR